MPKAKDVMSRHVVYVTKDTPMLEAANLLVINDITGIPVVDEAMHLVGIITERDILDLYEILQYPNDRTVNASMSREVISFDVEDDLSDLCTCLGASDFRRNWKETYGKDEETGRDCVFVTFVGPPVNTAGYWKVQFDVQTKLPIRAGVWWSENYDGEPHFDYASIEYGRAVPQGCFDFNVPEGTQVVDCRQLDDRLDKDPDCGMSVAQMSTSEACTKVVQEYWQAVIDENWEAVKGLRPLAGDNGLEQLRALYGKHQPAELLEIAGMNHLDDPGTFVEAACIVKMKDGTIKRSVLNAAIRQAARGRRGAIAGSIMGELTEID